MPNVVLIPFPGVGTPTLTREQFEAALLAGRELASPAPAVAEASPQRLVDAETLEQTTGVPRSWWMAQARERRIPCRKIGRRVRFVLDEVMASDFVFPSRAGGPMDATDVLRLGLYPALRRAGIGQVRPHDLRHSFASNLLAAGVDVVTVSKALGHASPHITMTIYAHALPSARRGTAEKMAQPMEESGKKRKQTCRTACRLRSEDP